MKTIRTKYHGPTNTKGAKISATDGDGNRVRISYPDNKRSGEEAHAEAAMELCRKMNWSGPLVAGWIKGDEWAFNFIENAGGPTNVYHPDGEPLPEHRVLVEFHVRAVTPEAAASIVDSVIGHTDDGIAGNWEKDLWSALQCEAHGVDPEDLPEDFEPDPDAAGYRWDRV